jgi:hypothetical protein
MRQRDPDRFSASASPMPESIRICGELAPPARSLAPRPHPDDPAMVVLTPTARVPSNTMRVTRQRGAMRRFRARA